MATIASLQQERDNHVANLKELDEVLAEMPDYQEAIDMKAEVLIQLESIDAQISALKKQTLSPTVDTTPTEKWKKEDHPAFRKQAVNPSPTEEKKAPVVYKVNDTVTAKYAGDKQFYEARIISITGSSVNPIYTVNFKGYTGTETVRAHELRPFNSTASSGAQKRKADDSPIAPSPATPVTSTPMPGVISAAANIDTEKANALKKEAAKLLDADSKPKTAKKARTSKALESSKHNWQAWQSKASTGKAAKVAAKDSMFRTGEAPTARVGFTGSGQAMRKDVARTRHNYTLDD
ncbi:hypothetical protein BDV97DRAFT_413622 [Delphinella strobiligena]|nr:hypothetical protein BDV97DRAFT_413622 [Delphinella strobiligena]